MSTSPVNNNAPAPVTWKDVNDKMSMNQAASTGMKIVQKALQNATQASQEKKD